MRAALQFLGEFVLASAVGLVIWVPLAGVYFDGLAYQVDGIFWLSNQDASLEVDDEGVYILYRDIFPEYRGKRDVKIPILRSLAIHFNVVVLFALFFATPGMGPDKKVRNALVALAVLSVCHACHVYFASHLIIWDYLEWRRWPVEVPEHIVQQLSANILEQYPLSRRPVIEGLYEYWTHFLDESAPMLAWLYYAHPYLGSKITAFRRSTAG